MSEDMQSAEELETYPGGITEREGHVSLFLKATYVGVLIFAAVYFFLYLSGDGSPLVELLNKATQ